MSYIAIGATFQEARDASDPQTGRMAADTMARLIDYDMFAKGDRRESRNC
jgi:hypothetical protein